ncbi:helix-turn-helix transcriptional regulator [Pseudomonas fulva]|nr:helix-turn-helix transcriptional regulator [Pseudomonas fulva]
MFVFCWADIGARTCTCQLKGVRLSTIGERLREERDRLDLSQTAFAELGGVQKRAQINYEKDDRHPDAGYLAAIAAANVDVLYVLTGERLVRPESIEPAVAGPTTIGVIDTQRLERIVELLEASASKVGKQWPARRLVSMAAEVYNVLADEVTLDEPKVDRILKLVVNR